MESVMRVLRLSSLLMVVVGVPLHVRGAEGNLPLERIGANDLVSVYVYAAPELTRDIRVSSEGVLRLPLATRGIPAAGMLPSELEHAITAELVKDKLFIDPVVTVTVAEYRSRTITVAGAVRKSLTFQHTGAVRLIDALVRADGLAPDAGPEILVTRSAAGRQDAPALSHRISVRALYDGDPAANLLLDTGDEVRVPTSEKVFVLGNVRKPGAFRYEDANDMTVRKVLALSDGLLPYAGRTAWLYRKRHAGTEEIAVELGKIIDRKTADVPMQAGDMLYVPDNKSKRMTMSALERMATFAAGTTSGMLIWRR